MKSPDQRQPHSPPDRLRRHQGHEPLGTPTRSGPLEEPSQRRTPFNNIHHESKSLSQTRQSNREVIGTEEWPLQHFEGTSNHHVIHDTHYPSEFCKNRDPGPEPYNDDDIRKEHVFGLEPDTHSVMMDISIREAIPEVTYRSLRAFVEENTQRLAVLPYYRIQCSGSKETYGRNCELEQKAKWLTSKPDPFRAEWSTYRLRDFSGRHDVEPEPPDRIVGLARQWNRIHADDPSHSMRAKRNKPGQWDRLQARDSCTEGDEAETDPRDGCQYSPPTVEVPQAMSESPSDATILRPTSELPEGEGDSYAVRTNAGHRCEVGVQQTIQVSGNLSREATIDRYKSQDYRIERVPHVQWIFLKVIHYLIQVSAKGSALQRAAQSHDLARYAESEALTRTRKPKQRANRPISLSPLLSIVIPYATRRSMTNQSRNILGSMPLPSLPPRSFLLDTHPSSVPRDFKAFPFSTLSLNTHLQEYQFMYSSLSLLALGLCQETRTPATFFLFLPTTDTPPFLSLATFPLYVLPNRPLSPPSLAFIVASSLT